MKKFIILIALFIVSATTTYAQFEKGKWYINGSFIGIGPSDAKHFDGNNGIGLEVGNFLEDNFALTINYKLAHYYHSIGAQTKYYLSNCGIYGGMGVSYKSITNSEVSKKHFVYFTPEVGYAFFLNGFMTIEPSIYYNFSIDRPADYSMFGLKLGLGFYF